jgi:hypothetical protein
MTIREKRRWFFIRNFNLLYDLIEITDKAHALFLEALVSDTDELEAFDVDTFIDDRDELYSEVDEINDKYEVDIFKTNERNELDTEIIDDAYELECALEYQLYDINQIILDVEAFLAKNDFTIDEVKEKVIKAFAIAA